MFHINNSIKVLDPKKRQVYGMITSINQPSVALADAPASPTFGFICSLWSEDQKGIEVFIMLYQPAKDIAVFYTHEDGLISEDDYWHVENEALSFAESMGFMMDNLNFQDLSEVRQQEVIHNLPPFMSNRKLYQAARPVSAPTPKSPPPPEDYVELDVDAEVVLHHSSEAPADEASLAPEEVSSFSEGMERTVFESSPLDSAEISLTTSNSAPAAEEVAKTSNPKNLEALMRLLTSF